MSARDPSAPAAGRLLVDFELEQLAKSAILAAPGTGSIAADQIQPASLDLRLGAFAARLRASFLPGAISIEERLRELEESRVALDGEGAVLERGQVYVAPLEEELALPHGMRAAFNPRSSTGRCDLFARVLVPGHARFDAAPAGYRGKLWVEIAPLSFPVRVARGDRLVQVRLAQGDAALSDAELRVEHARSPLCFDARGPIPPERVQFDGDGGIALHLGLAGRDPAGWRAQAHTGVLDFARDGANDPAAFWDPIHAPEGRHILTPERFYLFASRERVCIPPHLAAEMEPVDVHLGEMRNNYAGFFDNGFGWSAAGSRGTPAVLEVRAHDVPFQVEDGQVFFRLRYFRTSSRPRKLYGEGREANSYRDQDLTLARCFRAP
jgi:dCTP deaminase